MANPIRYSPYYLIRINSRKAFESGRNKEITSVTVTDHSSQSDEFEFKIRDFGSTDGHFPQDRLRWIDDSMLQLGNEVEIIMGYMESGAKDSVLLGEITRTEPNFPEDGGIEITVSGFSLFHRLQKNSRTQKFIAMNYAQIINRIAADNGLQADVNVSTIKDDYILQGKSGDGETDAEFLQKLADKYSAEVVVKKRTLYFREIANNAAPSLTLRWGEDLKSFAPSININSLKTQVIVQGVASEVGGDVDEGANFQTSVKQPPSTAHRMGKQLGTDIARKALKKDSDDRIEGLKVSSSQEAEKIAKARFNRNALEFLKGNGATAGNTRIKAGEVVKIDRLGNQFSGNFYVTQATYTIDDSGFSTTFETKRAGIGK